MSGPLALQLARGGLLEATAMYLRPARMATMAVPVIVYVLGAAAVAVEHSTRQGVIGLPTSLPEWPLRTIAVLVTVDDSPHAIPVSAPVRAGDHRILLSLHRTRDSLGRLRDRPRVALAILAEGNVAFTARGIARVVDEPMTDAPDYAAVEIDVTDLDDHRQEAFTVEAGVDRKWIDENEKRALGQRVSTLQHLAAASGSPSASAPPY